VEINFETLSPFARRALWFALTGQVKNHVTVDDFRGQDLSSLRPLLEEVEENREAGWAPCPTPPEEDGRAWTVPCATDDWGADDGDSYLLAVLGALEAPYDGEDVVVSSEQDAVAAACAILRAQEQEAEGNCVNWLVWRTHLRNGRVRVTVAAVVGDWERAAQARYQQGVAYRDSLEAPRRALRDGSLYREFLRRAEAEDCFCSRDLRYLAEALQETGILPGGER